MDNSTTRLLILLIFILTVVSTISVTLQFAGKGAGEAAENSKTVASSINRAEVEDIIARYIKDNPKAIMSSLLVAQAEQRKNREQAAQASVGDKLDELENDPTTPWLGSENPTATIVEFFDYNCGYCKKVAPQLAQLLKEDKNLRVVLKDFPIFQEPSENAAKAAIAAFEISKDKDKFWDFHIQLLQRRAKTVDQIIEAANSVGLDGKAIKEAIKDPKYAEKIKSNQELGRSIGVRGTPAFVIGGKFVRGAIDIERMRTLIKAAREEG